MTKPYTHLAQEKRYQISAYKKAGFTPSQIAQDLNRDVSTICHEVARNTGMKGYRPKQAHCFASDRLLIPTILGSAG